MKQKKRIYHIVSIGENININIQTHKKTELNRLCKYISKYGNNQKTTIQEL